MRLPADPLLPTPPSGASDYERQLALRLTQLFREFAAQVNALGEGGIQGTTNAQPASPTTGSWQQGDQIKNSTPTETGTAGSKYVVGGWICIAAGTPGTWREMRWLTGN